jgi:hypothetical protein
MDRDEAIEILPPAFDCRVCRERLHLYLEGEADSFTARHIGDHLEGCPDCREELRQLEEERVHFLEAALVSPPLSPKFSTQVIDKVRRIESEERSRKRNVLLRRLAVGAAAAAAVVLASIGMVQVLRSGGPAAGPMEIARPSLPAVRGAEGFNKKFAPRRAPDRADLGVPGPGAPFLPPRPAPYREPEMERRSFDFADWYETSANLFPREQLLTCRRDLNSDGQANPSDAAHLIMLSLLTVPSETIRNDDEIDPECFQICRS